MTPLITNATQKDDCAEVTELLLDAGADIHAKDAAGKTALDWAKETKAPNICKILEAHLS
jgi:ankyrin repeat protein